VRVAQSTRLITSLILVFAMGSSATELVKLEAQPIMPPSSLSYASQRNDQSGVQARLATNSHKGHVNGDAPSDIKCSVLEWNTGLPKPILTLVCPPEEVFAPLRVYFKLSWATPEDVPSDYLAIVATPRGQMKFHWTRDELHVLLPIKREGREKRQVKWVVFTEVVGFYLGNSNKDAENCCVGALPKN
jgi:hypothetical protein